MTQQIDHRYAAAPVHGLAPAPDAVRTTVVPQRSGPPGGWVPQGPPAPPAGMSPVPPPGLPPFVPTPRPSGGAGTTVGIVLGAVGGTLVLIVILLVVVGTLYSGASSPAPAAPAAPSSAPAAPYAPSSPPAGSSSAAPYSGTTQVFAPAGRRLDAARATLDQQLAKASQAEDLDAFHAAFTTFRGELETYRAAVAGLPMPADQQAAFATLRSAVDATVASCGDAAAADDARSLSSAATGFDQNWKALVTTHNQLIDALPAA